MLLHQLQFQLRQWALLQVHVLEKEVNNMRPVTFMIMMREPAKQSLFRTCRSPVPPKWHGTLLHTCPTRFGAGGV